MLPVCRIRRLVNAQGIIDTVPGTEYTEMGWEVHPPALGKQLDKINSNYILPPIYVTENGATFKDKVGPDG